MKKLSRASLRKLIRNEVRSIVDEDALLSSPDIGEPYYVPRDEMEYDDHDHSLSAQPCSACGDDHDDSPCAAEQDPFLDTLGVRSDLYELSDVYNRTGRRKRNDRS
jgi:hypothetical protein